MIQEAQACKRGELGMSPRSCASTGSTITAPAASWCSSGTAGDSSAEEARRNQHASAPRRGNSCCSCSPREKEIEVFDSPSDDEPLAGPEDVAAIEEHLSSMNAASEELNRLQRERHDILERRRDLCQMWAVGSARLVKTIGTERLARAAPIVELQRACKASREAVEKASNAYARGAESGAPAERLAELASGHVEVVVAYQAAQRRLDKVSKASCLSTSSLKSMQPYFEAEEQHKERLDEVEQDILTLERQLDEAKRRYQGAMQDLEALSESIRMQRIAGMKESSPTRSSRASALQDARRWR
jgi:peptide methionine sulfoxide reductase MsrA